jgi:hypothetical protein
MKTCQDFQDLLHDYALDALKPPKRGELEGHLQNCSACSTTLDEFRARKEKIEAGLHQLVQRHGPSPGFGARVMATLPSEQRHFGGRLGWGAALATVTAALLVLVSTGSWVLPPKQADLTTTNLSNWKSPTAGLLRYSGNELLRSEVELGHFYFSLESIQVLREEETHEGGNHEN